jgi:hypothetical protein
MGGSKATSVRFLADEPKVFAGFDCIIFATPKNDKPLFLRSDHFRENHPDLETARSERVRQRARLHPKLCGCLVCSAGCTPAHLAHSMAGLTHG